jgi:hypothetical protein
MNWTPDWKTSGVFAFKCGELMKKIFDLIEKYDLSIDYKGFDTSIIWSYLK